MPTIQIPHNWKPRDYQMPFWTAMERGCRRALKFWHRRAGKDECDLMWTATAGMQRVGNYWHLLPEQSQARKAIWEAVNPHTGKRRIDEAFPPLIRARTRDQEMAITLVNGSTWQVLGSDNYNSLLGSPPIGVVFSEWPLAKPSAWAFIRPILLENGGWAIFNGTPRGKNHAHAMLEAHQDDPDWFTEVRPADQTNVFTPEQLQAERREYVAEYGEAGESLFQQEYFCSFEAAILGAYYGKELAKATADGRILALPYRPQAPVYTAWDLGIGDTTAIWFAQIIDGWFHVIDFYEATGEGLPHYAKVLQERPYVYADHFLPHDARNREWGSGKSRLETARELLPGTIRIVNNVPVDDGINAVRLTLPSMRFDEDKCADGIEALRQYRKDWDEDKRTFKDQPRHDWTSHAADGMRYLCLGWREKTGTRSENPIRTPTFDEMLAANVKRMRAYG